MNLFLKHFYFSAVIGFGSWTNGVIASYYSPIADTMPPEIGMSNFEANLFNTFGIIFAAVGGLVAKPFVRFVGRRLSVFIVAILTIAAWIVMGLTKTFWLAYFSRVLQGIILGISTTICPLYLIELAPTQYRGTFGSFHQIFVNLGQLYVYLLGIFLQWRSLTWLCMITAGLSAILIFTIPDSHVVETSGKSESIFQEKFLANFLHSLGMVFFQQFSGINAVITNMNTIFEEANTGLNPGVASCIVGLAELVATIICSYIIEKIGRRPTWIIACFGTCISLILLWVNELWKIWPILPLIGLIIYMLGFGLGLGPIVWTIIPELFPDSARSSFLAIAVTINWLLGGVVTYLWPVMNAGIGTGWSFFIYSMICLASGIYGIFLMPETTGAKAGGESRVHNFLTSESSESDKESKVHISEEASDSNDSFAH